VIAAGRIGSMAYVAIGMLVLAVALEAIDRRENRRLSVSGQQENVDA
jgi:hypothetical protein